MFPHRDWGISSDRLSGHLFRIGLRDVFFSVGAMQLSNVCRSLSNDSVSRRMCFGKHSVAFLLRDGLDVSLRVGLAMFTASALKHFVWQGCRGFYFRSGLVSGHLGGLLCMSSGTGFTTFPSERVQGHFLASKHCFQNCFATKRPKPFLTKKKTKPFPLNMSETPSLSKPPATFPTSDDPK